MAPAIGKNKKRLKLGSLRTKQITVSPCQYRCHHISDERLNLLKSYNIILMLLLRHGKAGKFFESEISLL